MKIRRARPDEYSRLKRLGRKYNFPVQGPRDMYLAEEESKSIGFIGFKRYAWNKTIRVTDLFVIPEARKKGIARELVNYVIAKLRKTSYRCIMLETPSSWLAKEFYKKIGFRRCGYNDRYYTNKGDDIAIWMSYDLS